MRITLDGAETLDAGLSTLGPRIAEALAAKAQALAATLRDHVRDDKLSGQVLNIVSGALRDSIVGSVEPTATGFVASVGSSGDIKYAAIQEYGGKTAAHEILPSKGAVLAFFSGGALRFARRIEHPGSVIPERSYLRSSLADLGEAIVADLATTPEDEWRDA